MIELPGAIDKMEFDQARRRSDVLSKSNRGPALSRLPSKGVQDKLPDASIVFNRLHVVKPINEAVAKVGR